MEIMVEHQGRLYLTPEVYEEVESLELEMVSMHRPSTLTINEGDMLVLSADLHAEDCRHIQNALNDWYGFQIPLFVLPVGSTIAGVLSPKGKE